MDDIFKGMKEKFIVIKNEDCTKYLTIEEKGHLCRIMSSITSGRLLDHKNSRNKYLVINIDEPYAPEIVEILKKNGHWG